MKPVLKFLGFGRARRLRSMAQSARFGIRKMNAAAAGYLPKEFFRYAIRGTEGISRTRGARPLKEYRKGYTLAVCIQVGE